MTKKYFEIPSVKLVSMTADVIATSVGLNNDEGNGPLAPEPRRRSIWD